MLRIDTVETPIGTLYLAAEGEALRELSFRPIDGPREKLPASERVKAYFAGDLKALDEVAVDPAGTPFQKSVWKLLREIPPGQTMPPLKVAVDEAVYVVEGRGLTSIWQEPGGETVSFEW